MKDKSTRILMYVVIGLFFSKGILCLMAMHPTLGPVLSPPVVIVCIYLMSVLFGELLFAVGSMTFGAVYLFVAFDLRRNRKPAAVTGFLLTCFSLLYGLIEYFEILPLFRSILWTDVSCRVLVHAVFDLVLLTLITIRWKANMRSGPDTEQLRG